MFLHKVGGVTTFGKRGLLVSAALSSLFLSAFLVPAKADETSALAQTSTDVFARVVPLQLQRNAAQPCARQLGPLSLIPKPFPLHLRLGALLSPRTKFDGGIDVTLGRGIFPGTSTRIDADVILSASFAGISTLVPVTLDQIYAKGLIGGNRIYLGVGAGPYIADKTRFGGKLFIGADLAVRVGVEGAVHFSGTGDPLLTLQARIGL